MPEEIEERTVGITRYYFAIPSWRRTAVYLVIFSFIAGLALHVAISLANARLGIPGVAPQVSWSDALLFGGTGGIILFAFPAMISAVLAAGFHPKAFRTNFRRFLFVGLASAIVAVVAYALGIVLAAQASDFHAAILLANALVYLLWFVSCFLAMGMGPASFIAAVFNPVLNITFLQMWQAYGTLEMGSPALIALKLIVACGIMLLALWSLFFVINAPAKRNFGISSIQATTLFFAQMMKGSQALEGVLEEMGESADTLLGMVAFRSKKGHRLKALFVVPHVHFGPFGNLGGSEFPFLLSEMLSRRFGCETFVFHSTTTHDFNPVHASAVLNVSAAYARRLGELSKRSNARAFSSNASLLSGEANNAKARGIAFGGNAFLALTRAPKRTEDVDFAAGLALKARAESRGYEQALLADAHNSIGISKWIEAGSEEFYEYDDALASIASSGEAARHAAQLKIGVASAGMGATPAQGVGKSGVKVAVFELGGSAGAGAGKGRGRGGGAKARACIVVVDGNNALPEFRAAVLESLGKYKFDWSELLTTDTHSVNSLAEAYNPLGKHAEVSLELIKVIDDCVQRAVADLQPVEAAMDVQRARVAVLGAKRAPELLSTINSVVSVTKILAPAIFVASIALAFLSLVLLK